MVTRPLLALLLIGTLTVLPAAQAAPKTEFGVVDSPDRPQVSSDHVRYDYWVHTNAYCKKDSMAHVLVETDNIHACVGLLDALLLLWVLC